MSTREAGKRAEELAAKALKKKGYKILEKNYRSPTGSEIDIIATEGKYLVFIEVKSRKSLAFGTPEEAIDGKKRQKLIQASLFYLENHGLMGKKPCRFDVVSIIEEPEGGKKEVRIIKNAFQVESVK